MKSYIRVSSATKTDRREAVKTLRHLLDCHVNRKMAFIHVRKVLKSMGLPNSRATIYKWAKEFKIKTT